MDMCKNRKWNNIFKGLVSVSALSNKELIDIFGVSHSTLSNWLNFKTSPTLKLKPKIKSLGLHYMDLESLEKIGNYNWKF